MIVAGWRRMTVSLHVRVMTAFCSSVGNPPHDVQGRSELSCFRNVSSRPFVGMIRAKSSFKEQTAPPKPDLQAPDQGEHDALCHPRLPRRSRGDVLDAAGGCGG